MEHEELAEKMEHSLQVKTQVDELIQSKLIDEVQLYEEVASVHGSFHNNPVGFALHHFEFYFCDDCKAPYCGGAHVCAVEQDSDAYYRCDSCFVKHVNIQAACDKHGTKFLAYKCRYCCIALPTFFCHGHTHYCVVCHNNPSDCKPKPCTKGECLFKCDHPENGMEYALGCAACARS
jgi:hypothetical protein